MKPTFKKTRKYLNDIPSINYGGCGFAALALYDAAKREGHKPKIVYLYSWLDNEAMERNNKFKLGKVKKAHSCSHVLVKIKNKFWDSTGVIPKSGLGMYQLDDTITRDHLVASINNKGVWNPCFQRWAWISEIKNMIKKGTVLEA